MPQRLTHDSKMILFPVIKLTSSANLRWVALMVEKIYKPLSGWLMLVVGPVLLFGGVGLCLN